MRDTEKVPSRKKNTRVVLVMPSEDCDSPYPMQRRTPLLGVGYLAGALMQHEYEVDIVDALAENLSSEKVLQRVKDFGAQVVGLSLDLLSYGFVSKLATLCKEQKIWVVVGGPEVTTNSEEVLERIMADIGVLGEGEQTVLELLQVLESEGAWSTERISHIAGIVFRDSGGSVKKTLVRPRIVDLDSLPFIPYESFPMARYDLRYPILRRGPVFPVYTSRGCPYNCSFCSSREIWYRKCFFMSAERVVDEMDHIVKKYSPAGIYFHDDNFTLKKQRVVDICEGLLKRSIKVRWACLGRTDGLEQDLFRLMKRAGCQGIWFGIESGSNRILSLIRKEICLENVLKVVNAGRQAGLAIGASIIVGFPTQTMEEENETIEFLTEARFTFVMIAPYVGYPGSDMYREYLADGGRHVYSKKKGIVLPNSEDMTWPQKVEWARLHERKFNRTLRLVREYVKTYGVSSTIRHVVKTAIRDLKRPKLYGVKR